MVIQKPLIVFPRSVLVLSEETHADDSLQTYGYEEAHVLGAASLVARVSKIQQLWGSWRAWSKGHGGLQVLSSVALVPLYFSARM